MTSFTLVTGASEGLGAEFARLAVKDGRNVILTARSLDKLKTLAEELRSKGAEVLVIPADLSDPRDAERLWAEAIDERRVDVLVNNAGLGYNGAFSDPTAWPRERNSMQVNMFSYTYLLKQAVAHMQETGGGRVLNVASVAGFMAGPNMAVYHATKAYALSLSEAVAEELRGTNVTVTALCPGATATNFFADAEMQDIHLLKTGGVMKAFPVAEEGWLEARIGKRIVVPGLMNKLLVLLTRVMPRSVTSRITAKLMGKA